MVRQYARTGAVIYAGPAYLEAERMPTRPPHPPGITSRLPIACAPRRRGTATSSCPASHPDILDLFAPDFYIVGFDRPNPMARQEDSEYHESCSPDNFDPSPMLNRQRSLLDNPGLVSL